MKSIRYSRYTGDDLGISAEDLMKALSDFFLESGFHNQYMGFSEWNEHTLEQLKEALKYNPSKEEKQKIQELITRLG